MKGVKVTCSAGFLLLAASLIYLDGVRLFVQVLIACILHEAGHYGAARSFGSRVCTLRLTAAGAEMKLDPRVQLSYVQDALLAFSGPAVNLTAAWLAARAEANLFVGLNLSLGLLNLLPIRPLDGGRILTDLLSLLDPELAEKIHSGLSVLVSGALLGLGWAAWRGWGNLSLLYIAVWLVAGALKDQKLMYK